MALIVEDGSGVAGAESYCTVVYATAYHANRGNAAWAALASDTIREQSLRKATDYLTQIFNGRWKGYKTHTDQPLDWPRQNVYREDSGFKIYVDSETIPVELKNACCELALKSTTEDLNPDIERQTASESIGSLSVSYVPGSRQTKQYKVIDMILRPLLKNDGAGIQLVRS